MSKCEYINKFTYTKFLQLMEHLANSNDPDATSIQHHIVMENSSGELYDMVISYNEQKGQWVYKWKLHVEETVEETVDKNKIIVVIYHSGLTKWYPFSLENMESIIWDFDNIHDIQIIEKGE